MDEETVELETIEPANLKPDIRAAYDLLVEVCKASGLECHPEVRDVTLPYVSIELVGDDVAQTCARNGQSLDALQLLCNAIMAQRIEGDVRIALDGAGYRSKRASALIELARELAPSVAAVCSPSTGRPSGRIRSPDFTSMPRFAILKAGLAVKVWVQAHPRIGKSC